MNKRTKGAEREREAARWLESQGFEILEQNFRCRSGEIDLIARERTDYGTYLVFIEVKYRADLKKGFPQEAVNSYKRRHICKVARFFLLSHHYKEDTACRFDVVAICADQIELIRNAFPFVL